MGGEGEKFINEVHGKEVSCYMGGKDHAVVLDSFEAYPHEGGLKDKNGKRWWVYFRCPVCDHCWKFGNIPWLIRRTEQ